MPLTNVMTVDVEPSRGRHYLELCHELAEHAKNKHDRFQWTAHETRIGAGNRIHFAASADDFASLEAMGSPEEMIPRVLGADRARDPVLQDAIERKRI